MDFATTGGIVARYWKGVEFVKILPTVVVLCVADVIVVSTLLEVVGFFGNNFPNSDMNHMTQIMIIFRFNQITI